MCFLLLLMTRTQRVVSFFLSSSFSLSEWWLSWSGWFSSRFRFDSVPSRLSGDCPGSVWFSALFFLLSEQWLSRSFWFSASQLWIPLSSVEFEKKKTFRPQGRVRLCNSKKLLLCLYYQRRKSEDPPTCYSGANIPIRILWLHVSFISRHSKLDDCTSSSMYRF